MTIKFRPFGGEPGEQLLSPVDPHEAGVRYTRFVARTGLAGEDIVTSNTTCTPIPLYPPSWPQGRNRWNNVRANTMWHPLMWLPPRLAARAHLNIDGATTVETDELWAARVAIEMTACGMYDEEAGEWVDVLALYGLDIDDPQVVERVEGWLAGQPDETLDQIDLTDRFRPDDDDNDWAFPIAFEAVDVLRPVAWVIHAESLIGDCEGLIQFAGDLDDEQLAKSARSLFALASFSMNGLPDHLEPAWWRTAFSSWDGTRDTMVDIVLPKARNLLVGVREEFWAEAMETVALGEGLIDAANETDDDDDLADSDDTPDW